MKRLVNRMLGYGRITVEGAFPERLLNLCAQRRIPFWGVAWQGETTLTLHVRLRSVRELEELAARAMCTVTERRFFGLTAALLRFRRRKGFLAGLALAFLTAAALSRFVLVVEVTGNEQVPTAVILSQLQLLGVGPGVYGPGLDRTELANRALLALPELSFLSINLYGTRLEVVVREAVKAPEVLDESVPADVVAAADGIITDIHTTAGAPLFEQGDTVTAGEVLISGDVALRVPADSGEGAGRLVVRAAGEVFARTWRTLSASIPLTAGEKCYTGAEKTVYSGKFLWKRVEFFGNSGISYEKYDKITKTMVIRLLGQELPLSLTAVTFREYTLRTAALDEGAAGELLEEELLARLAVLLAPGGGEVARADFVHRAEGGVLTVTMLAECTEQIGRTVERAGKTGIVYEESSGLPE